MSFILAITGPAGAGKSTVARKVARIVEKCVDIDVDYMKAFIVNGFIYDETPEGIKQWRLLGENIGIVAKNFVDAGYNVIVNGYLDESAWQNIEKFVAFTDKMLLMPHIKANIDRDMQRVGDLVMGEETILRHHDYFSTNGYYGDYIKLDTTDHTTEDTVRDILNIIAQSKPVLS
jgi:adenylate kinase family enzyme